MTRLDRYVIRLAAGPFLLGLLFGAALLSLFEGTDVHASAIERGVPGGMVFAFLLRALPFHLVVAAPVAVLLAAAAAIGSLARSGELLAMRASGIPPGRAVAAVVAAAGAVSLLLLAAGEWGVPSLYGEATEIRRTIEGRAVASPVFLDGALVLGQRLLRLGRFEPSEGRAERVEIDDPDAAFSTIARRITADTALWDGRQWVLRGAETVRFEADRVSVERHDTALLDLGVGPEGVATLLAAQRVRFLLEDRPAETRRFSDLIREIRLFRAVKSGEGHRYRNRLRTDFHAKAALALAPVALALLGAGAAAGTGRRSHPAASAAVTLLVAFGMWFGLEAARALGAASRFPAAIPWIPFLAAIAAGVALIRRAG